MIEREEFEAWCKRDCSPGAETSGWYWRIWRAAWQAARAQPSQPQQEPVAWMYETERSCAGPFTERKTIFTIDRWSEVPSTYRETPLYAAMEEQTP